MHRNLPVPGTQGHCSGCVIHHPCNFVTMADADWGSSSDEEDAAERARKDEIKRQETLVSLRHCFSCRCHWLLACPFRNPACTFLYLTQTPDPCLQALLESFQKTREPEVEKGYGSIDPAARFYAERSQAAGKAMWSERQSRMGKEAEEQKDIDSSMKVYAALTFTPCHKTFRHVSYFLPTECVLVSRC